MTCPHCTADLPDDDIFCESCGERLSESPPAQTSPLCLCGAPDSELDEDGYCISCGRRCRPAPGEHEEKQLSAEFAAVSDRGCHHHRNEDRFEIEFDGGRYVIVVCDGVSTSSDADTASTAASKCIAEELLRGCGVDSALQNARECVARVAEQYPAGNSPSTTAVAAVVENRAARVAWIGDSRAYWISKTDSKQLTSDHSWLNDVVSSGELSYAEAEKSPQAHAITRWIGADAGADIAADTITFSIPGAGWLMLCTDGLWNYVPQTEDLAGLVHEFPSQATALEIARQLVAYANEKGGSDNITIALLGFAD